MEFGEMIFMDPSLVEEYLAEAGKDSGEEEGAGAIEDGSDDGVMKQQHPLLNDLVMRRAFEIMQPRVSFETLKSIRLVCSAWYRETLDWWRKTAVVKVIPTSDMFEEPPTSGVSAEDFLADIQFPSDFDALEDKPYEKYRLEKVNISIPYAFKKNTGSYKFWNEVGPLIKHLTLDRINFTGVPILEFNPELMKFLLEFLPNLKHLEMKGVTLNGGECNPFEIFTRQNRNISIIAHPEVVSLVVDNFGGVLQRNFPNLQEYTRKLPHSGKEMEVTSSFVFFLMRSPAVEDLVEFPNIKTLDFMEVPVVYEFFGAHEFISNLKFPSLQRLAINLEEHPIPPELEFFAEGEDINLLADLMQQHYDTLQVLEVLRSPAQTRFPNFPFGCQMTALVELRLWGNVANDLQFIKWTPNVKLLLMDFSAFEKKEAARRQARGFCQPLEHDIVERAVTEGDMDNVQLPNLEHLQISYKFCPESLKKLAEWMPNVKILKTELGSESLETICEQWPLLEELVGLYGSKLGDEDVVVQSGKGLLDLKELHLFHLFARCNEGAFTDEAGHSVFLKMEKLTDLLVSVGPKFTVEMEDMLRQRIQKVEVRRNHYDIDHWDLECCKNDEYIRFMHFNADFNVEGVFFGHSSDEDE